MRSFEDVALLLEVPVEFLWKIIIRDKLENYKSFKIKKKNGEDRTIYTSEKNLAILQKKLAYILSNIYFVHYRAHGFAKNRSIVTNASEHVNKKYVLNFDLENFFESIEFPRVRFMFKSYFGFNEKVSTTLANICCHPKGFLPQGAATSPILSNIIANGLDKDLTKISKNHKLSKYTRYADDITFSFNSKEFPKDIAETIDGKVILSDTIINIINKHGFKINNSKTRLKNHKENQTVTGITVNTKLNINRKYIKRIRSILHCIEKNIEDIEVAKEIFESKYPFRQSLNRVKPEMFSVLKGMISYVGSVKGKKDPIYIKFATRFNDLLDLNLSDLKPLKIPLTKNSFHEENTFVIDSDRSAWYYAKDGSTDEILYGQGTGFFLKNIGLITNAHVIEDVINVISNGDNFVSEYCVEFFKGNNETEIYYAKLVYYDVEKDIAVLMPKNIDIENLGYDYSENIYRNQKIELIGFPDYKKGQEIRVQDGFVQGVRIHENRQRNQKYKRFEISATIYGGNSGGPIVNEKNEVIAVAVKGATLSGVSPNEVIPISDVVKLVDKI